MNRLLHTAAIGTLFALCAYASDSSDREIEQTACRFYETVVLFGSEPDSAAIAGFCTKGFMKQLADANDMDCGGYAVWLLRTGHQDGDDTPDKVTDVTAGNNNTVLVKYRDMGHRGATILRFAETPDGWKIDGAFRPEGSSVFDL